LSRIALRDGTAADADLLTALCFRAKAHWGYSQDLLDGWADELTVSPLQFKKFMVRCACDETGCIVGFAMLSLAPPTAELEHLHVDPAVHKTGVGRSLLSDMMEYARQSGCTRLELDSDPHATGFYQKLGGVRIGNTPSAIIAGRSLPRLQIAIPSAS